MRPRGGWRWRDAIRALGAASSGCSKRSSRTIRRPPVLGTVHQHDLGVVVDLVDDPKVAPPCRVETFELTAKRLARPARGLSNRAEGRLDHPCSDFLPSS